MMPTLYINTDLALSGLSLLLDFSRALINIQGNILNEYKYLRAYIALPSVKSLFKKSDSVPALTAESKMRITRNSRLNLNKGINPFLKLILKQPTQMPRLNSHQ